MSFQKHYKKMIAVLLIFSMLFAVSACWSQGGTDVPSGNGDPGTKITEPGKNETPNTEVPGKHGNTEPAGSGTVDLMANVIPAASALKPISAESSKKAADFALKLFKACYNGENTLVSPLSLIAALGMTMEGAKGETLAEMEKALGFTSGELTDYIATLLDSLKNDEVLSLANSIWFTSHERFTVDEAFLKRNAAFYKAGIFKSPFDDTTVVDVNNWVREKTHDMIDGIIDECNPEDIMYLINALAFEGEWEEEFKENRISDGKFTTADGQKVDVKFMSSEEDTYLVTEKAEGFIKYYKGRKYAFAALLPNEGVSISDVLNDLNGEKLTALLANPQVGEKDVVLPKFESGDDRHLIDILQSFGMTAAFDPGMADLSGIGSSTGGNLFISDVHQKTFISVDEKGTKAAAVTVVEISDEAVSMPLVFNRPFIYMLIDTETNVPFFTGVLENPAK